jgi:hypothetical protein
VSRPVLLDTSFLVALERETIDADVVGSDRVAFERLGARYLRFV